MGLSSDRLAKLAKTIEDTEADTLVEWIIEGLNDVGIDHKENCALYRPHSHSADCDCGGDELKEKILKILDGN
jgi:hypothetical protein